MPKYALSHHNPVGKRGIGFDRLELDAYATYTKQAVGCPPKRKPLWKNHQQEKTEAKARRSPGLTKRGNIWWIDKRLKGLDSPLRESTGTSDLEEAERYLAKRISDIRNATIYGMRLERTFQEAAVKYLEENTHKRSLHVDAENLTSVMPFIKDLSLQRVHDSSLRPFVKHQLDKGLSQGTINRRLAIVRRILNLAARSWRDEHGLTWLETAPLITLPSYEPRQSYVLSWEEQRALFQRLPDYLSQACLFDVNCGAREQEVCQLRWDWEVQFEVGRCLFYRNS